MPPFAMPPQAPVGVWVGQGPAAELCVQTRHDSPEFGAGQLWKRTQRFLQNVPGVRHVDERGLRMGRGWEAQVQVATGLSQERPVVPDRGFHSPVPQAVPQPGSGVTEAMSRNRVLRPDRCCGDVRHPGVGVACERGTGRDQRGVEHSRRLEGILTPAGQDSEC